MYVVETYRAKEHGHGKHRAAHLYPAKTLHFYNLPPQAEPGPNDTWSWWEGWTLYVGWEEEEPEAEAVSA